MLEYGNLMFADKVDYNGRHFDVYVDDKGNRYFYQVVPTTDGSRYMTPFMEDVVALRANFDKIKAANLEAMAKRRKI